MTSHEKGFFSSLRLFLTINTYLEFVFVYFVEKIPCDTRWWKKKSLDVALGNALCSRVYCGLEPSTHPHVPSILYAIFQCGTPGLSVRTEPKNMAVIPKCRRNGRHQVNESELQVRIGSAKFRCVMSQFIGIGSPFHGKP